MRLVAGEVRDVLYEWDSSQVDRAKSGYDSRESPGKLLLVQSFKPV